MAENGLMGISGCTHCVPVLYLCVHDWLQWRSTCGRSEIAPPFAEVYLSVHIILHEAPSLSFTTFQKLKNPTKTITPTTRRLIWHQDVPEHKTRSVQTHHPHPLSPGPRHLPRALHNSYRNLQNGSPAVFPVQRYPPGQMKRVRA
ncbi:uncharacterized protein LACBIDRAFT_298162 [Laccaria bicolor S238N-H82]|uniref:Predicted protein n=1 Tax=Laccaria bicolor (strain S238N-H82 / ATCC MYA-4686) TaxID=486041 RepID=B0DCD3_LACBS|nr:uncharacterized protein LACBIDRAFT_298162 [Laccaria bicolor S238N-H82]EDR07708.1 predicted protein [Laccaria bicolor S238N-H82]|eukprot:XP_001881497.1 predicted protein [Laccaria bicolor S238N-H82]